jgi:hypothetical protein
MCQFKSMVVCRERILYSTSHDSHRKLLDDAGIPDRDDSPDFVKVEIVPRDYSEAALKDIDSWTFKIDQPSTPEWWNRKWAESECREILKKILVFPMVSWPGYLSINSNAKLDAPMLKSVGGYLSINSNAKLDAPMLKSVGGYLYINSNVKLDAPMLKSVGGKPYNQKREDA